jgi:molybdenum cofactor cytidylyltransferase
VRPVYRGQRGHPILFARTVFEALRRAPPEEGARFVVRALGDRVRDVVVDDPGITTDIDTPEAYTQAQQSLRGGR